LQTEIKAPSGKMYNLSPLTVDDICELKHYCQYMPYRQLYDHREEFPESIVGPQLDRLFDECSKKPVTEADIENHISTIEGARFLLYCSLRHNHEKLTMKEVGDLLTISNFQSIVKQLLMLSGLWQETTSKKNPPKKQKLSH